MSTNESIDIVLNETQVKDLRQMKDAGRTMIDNAMKHADKSKKIRFTTESGAVIVVVYDPKIA